MPAIANLGEIGSQGSADAILKPIDLPLLRNGVTWVLTGYNAVEIEVWESRTREAIASPGSIAIQDTATGTVRWTPTAASYPSGSYEARIRLSNDAGVTWEPSGLFRFSIGAGPTA